MQIYRMAVPLIFVSLFATCVLAQASPPEVELLADLATSPEGIGSGSNSWVRAGGLLYFLRTGSGETQLWRTDGSVAGTLRLRDFDTPNATQSLIGGELSDGRLLFVIDDPGLGEELWVSDGTPFGTRLVADLCPGSCDSSPGGNSSFLDRGDGFIRFGEEVLFAARTTSSFQLFAVDGTSALRQVSDLDIERWTAVGDKIFIVQSDEESTLWVSDGTAGSEQSLQTLAIRDIWSFLSVGDKVLMVARGHDGSLKLYSGDEQGLVEIISATGVGGAFRNTRVGTELAYVVLHDRLIRTDGTLGGTFELVRLTEGHFTSFVETVDERLCVVADTPETGSELWTSDGTSEGTFMVRDIVSGPGGSDPSRLTAFDSHLYFLTRGDGAPGLWRSDGTSDGTVEIRAFHDVDVGPFFPMSLGSLDGRLYFAAEELETGFEVWSSDGTPDGTSLFVNLRPDVDSSNPQSFLAGAEDVVLRANGGSSGSEYYRVAADGTVELSAERAEGGEILARAGSRVILENLEDLRFGPTHLTAWDPVTGDTQEVLTVPRVYTHADLGDRLVLLAGRPGSSGGALRLDALWTTRGTPETTEQLLQFSDEAPTGLVHLVVWRGEAYFIAETDPVTGGLELWGTDGTVAGTRKVRDLESVLGGWVLAASSDRLFVRTSVVGETDLLILGSGGQVHTVPLGDEFAEARPELDNVTIGERLVWTNYRTLASSDGTSAGTVILRTFDHVGPPTVSDGRAYFTAVTPEHGLELWTTDGTFAGTRLVRDIEPGPVSSDPAELVDVGGVLMFSARTAAEGRELWSSNGLAGGTRRLTDIAAGVGGSVPREITALGDRILFSAFREDVGIELFSLPRTATTANCTAASGTMCLGDGRFSLEIWWRNFEDETGIGRVVPGQSGDSGLFYFFDPGNWEVLVKVLDGCGFNDRFWVFSAATTNVEYVLRVTDTATGIHRDYANPLGRAAPAITDTDAFATCP